MAGKQVSSHAHLPRQTLQERIPPLTPLHAHGVRHGGHGGGFLAVFDYV